jgi:predicted transcriptional regulator
MEVTVIDKDLLAMIAAINQGPNRDALRKFVEFLYEEQEELTPEEWAAIREGQEDARQGRVITLEEYEKARGL